MQAGQGSRIDVADFKAQMLKKIGPERFKRYFYCLDRFINQKLSKVDFDRSCFQILGKENLPLHNQIIKAILKNACSANTPPQISNTGPTHSVIAAGKSSTYRENGHAQNGFVAHNQLSAAPNGANGSVLPTSPRKVRSARERKLRSTATEDSSAKILENGELVHCGYQRPLQHLQGFSGRPGIDDKLRLEKSSQIPVGLSGRDQNDAAVMEDGEEVEQGSCLNFPKSPLVAPLGIPFCSASVGGPRKSLPSVSTHDFVSSVDSGILSGSETLRQRMEQIAAACGLAGGVSMECANSLNNMLDLYLKGLIKSSCVRSDGESSNTDPVKNSLQRQQMHNKLMNGQWPGQRTKRPVSLQDFKVAMELQPQQLGEDWPSLMEKISMQAFEEGGG